MCQLFKGVRGLNDVRRRGDSATLDAEATRDFATDQSTSATPYGDITILGAEAARELATDRSTSATPSWRQCHPRCCSCPWTDPRPNAVL